MALRLEIERFWAGHFPDVRPIPHTLRDELSERWVRFHHLPESKRYPDTEAEIRTILARHDMIMEHLFGPEPLLVLAGLYLEPGEQAFTEPKLASVAGPFEFWKSASWDDEALPDEDLSMSLFVGRCDYERGREKIIRLVINEKCSNIVFLHPPAPVLYHPYDGGVDIITEHAQFRDFLRETFPDWLSKHPQGL